ncbi:E3 ubiquitin-protein ligase RNF181-like [Prorops nasuta]|uniref:E3 ubiquitin-protein ligase RNF181-like n=1 Tax=Prorops nasuta TaxID=863751 RepID=UPI0034CEA5E4
MGNCLQRGNSQQDNTTLLSSNPDPAMSSSLQEALGSSISYNEAIGSYYPPITSRERYLQSTDLSISRAIGVGVSIGPSTLNEEEEQVRIAKRMGLIQHLPIRQYTSSKKEECVICMMELVIGEKVRYLPCMHSYHAVCIDDWLLRSLICPTCMEPVDAALISSYHPTT